MSKDPVSEFRAALVAAVAGFGLDQLSETHIAQLEKHYAMLRKWNLKINLTRIVDAREAAKFHYAESLFGAKFILSSKTLLDIGSGPGFPAIPLAVVRPEVQVTALEVNQKKALFLKEAKDELCLANLKVEPTRLEEFDWSGYDFLTSRAFDHAEAIFPSVIERLDANQRLMLYCAPDLIAKLEGQADNEIEIHPIPHSESRMLAIFSRE